MLYTLKIWSLLDGVYASFILFYFNRISHIRNHRISREYHPAMDHCLNLQGQTDQEWNKMLSLFSYSIIGFRLEEKRAMVKSPGCYCFYKVYILWPLFRLRCSKNSILKKSDQNLKWYIVTATAKSLQSCPTLCNPIDSSPPGSPVPGFLQARTLEWFAISFSSAGKWKVKVKSLSRAWPSVTPWTAAFQAPPSMGFSSQEYWSGVALPPPDIL